MDAVEYLKERARMCNSYERCSECPLLNVGCGESNPDETVDIVEQWSREHPVMTNAQKFEKVFGKDALDILDLSCELDIWLDQPYKEPEGKE